MVRKKYTVSDSGQADWTWTYVTAYRMVVVASYWAAFPFPDYPRLLAVFWKNPCAIDKAGDTQDEPKTVNEKRLRKINRYWRGN